MANEDSLNFLLKFIADKYSAAVAVDTVKNTTNKIVSEVTKANAAMKLLSSNVTFTGDDQTKRGKLAINTVFGDDKGNIKRITASAKVADKEIQNFTHSTKVMAKQNIIASHSNKTLGASTAALALRAASVIPIWMALRTVMMGITEAVRAVIGTWLDLEKEMGRVAGVTRGGADDLNMLKQAVIDYSSTAVRGFKEAASAMYALGSAGLDVGEQLAGFEHIMNLSIGTFGNTEEIAKLVAGAYNVFGDALDDVYTKSAKFKRISDILAYTYSTQQVELSEIATAMTYVASVGSLMNIKFETLVGTIGVLNTGMLKGSKSGTSLMNAFAKLALSSDKLADMGIIFDPSQPLDFVDVMEQLYQKYKGQALSLNQLRELMQTFGRRGGRAVALMIKKFEDWKTTINRTEADFDDFARSMKEKAEDTLPQAFAKLGNAIKASFVDSLSKSEEPLRNLIKGVTELINNVNTLHKYKPMNIFGKIGLGILRTAMGDFTGLWTKALENEIAKKTGTLKEAKVEEEKSRFIKEILKDSVDYVDVKNKEKSIDDQINDIINKINDTTFTEKDARKEILDILKDSAYFQSLENKEMYKLLVGLKRVVELRKKEKELQGTVDPNFVKQLDKIKEAAKYEDMRLRKVDESVIAYVKLNDMVKRINKEVDAHNAKLGTKDEKGEIIKTKLDSLNINRLLMGDMQALYDISVHTAVKEKEMLEVQKQALKVKQEQVKEALEYSQILEKTLSSSFKDMMSGEGNFGDLLGNVKDAIVDTYRNEVSNELANIFTNVLGFGDLFEGAFRGLHKNLKNMSGVIENAHYEGGKLVANALKNAWTQIGLSMSGGRAVYGGVGATGGGFGGFGIGGGLLGGFMNQPAFTFGGTQGYYQKGGQKYYYGGQVGKTGTPVTWGNIAQGVMTGYSAFQSAQAGGKPMGQSIVSGLGMGIGSALFGGAMGAWASGAATFGAAMGPIGWIGLGLMAIGMAAGMFGGKKSKQTSVETKTSENKISTKIDVTNKSLEIINRNLVALRTDIRTYILPSSAYFAEKRNIEDQFSIQARRGFQG